MSNKHYRTPANLPPAPAPYEASAPKPGAKVSPPQANVAQRSIRAAMEGKPPSAEIPSDADSLGLLKRYLHQIIAIAADCLVGADDLVSVREGLQASRSLLTVIKHEQRLRERAEKAAREAAATGAEIAPVETLPDDLRVPPSTRAAIERGLAAVKEQMSKWRAVREQRALERERAEAAPAATP